MKHRLISVLLALVLSAVLILPATADSYPDRSGDVLDMAGVLSASTVNDVATLSSRLKSTTGGTLTVVTRHFLGGKDASSYAKALFDSWNLGSEDSVLLLVIGEESYAFYGGSSVNKLTNETINYLLGTQLMEQYKARNYDTAVGNFLTALSTRLAEKSGKTVSVSGLFGKTAASAQATQKPASSSSVWDGWDEFFSGGSSSQTAASTTSSKTNAPIIAREDKSTGFNMWTLVVIGFVMYLLFGKKKKGRHGCGPLGWIMGAVGIGSLFGRRR